MVAKVLAVSNNMDFIGPAGVGLAATGCIWNVRLHQDLVPLPNSGIESLPLAEIAR
jgi:hypothetical protein